MTEYHEHILDEITVSDIVMYLFTRIASKEDELVRLRKQKHFNGELETQIEKMKCCENCRWDAPSNFCDECTRFKGMISPEAVDNWELRR